MTNVIDYLFVNFEDSLISILILIVTLWKVIYRTMIGDVKFIKKLCDILIFERRFIISEEILRYAIATDNVVKDELQDLFSYSISKRYSFDPLGKIFSGNIDVFMVVGRIWKYLAYEVKTPM